MSSNLVGKSLKSQTDITDQWLRDRRTNRLLGFVICAMSAVTMVLVITALVKVVF